LFHYRFRQRRAGAGERRQADLVLAQLEPEPMLSIERIERLACGSGDFRSDAVSG
jgi:hypothetical protein